MTIRSILLTSDHLKERTHYARGAQAAADVIEVKSQILGFTDKPFGEGFPLDDQILVVLIDEYEDKPQEGLEEGSVVIHIGALERLVDAKAFRVTGFKEDRFGRWANILPICGYPEWLARHRVHHPRILEGLPDALGLGYRDQLHEFYAWRTLGKELWERVEEPPWESGVRPGRGNHG